MAQADSPLGPLTTTFTPAGSLSCGSIFVASNTNASPWLQLGNAAQPTACFPPEYNRGIRYYYSPGVCPSGFTYNPTTGDPENHVQTAICCPNGFMPKQWKDLNDTINPAICSGRISTATLATLDFYQYGVDDKPLTGVTKTALSFGQNIDAWGVVVHRQETDPTWALETGTNLPYQTISPGGGASNGPDATASSSSESLGGGAIAVICLGVLLALVCIAVIMYAAYRIRKFKKKQKLGDDDLPVRVSEVARTGAPQDPKLDDRKGKCDGRTPELDTPRPPVELG